MANFQMVAKLCAWKLTWHLAISICATLWFTAFAAPITIIQAINGAFTRCMITRIVFRTQLKILPIHCVLWNLKHTAHCMIGCWIIFRFNRIRVNMNFRVWSYCILSLQNENWIKWLMKIMFQAGTIQECQRFQAWEDAVTRQRVCVCLPNVWGFPSPKTWWIWAFWKVQSVKNWKTLRHV